MAETYEVPSWLIENESPPTRPTEILLPVTMAVRPIWSHNENRGGWFGCLEIVPFPDPVWECDHVHDGLEKAWECAYQAALNVARIYCQQGRIGPDRDVR